MSIEWDVPDHTVDSVRYYFQAMRYAMFQKAAAMMGPKRSDFLHVPGYFWLEPRVGGETV